MDELNQLTQALIKCTDPEVLYLQETHLDSGRIIKINGYYWIRHNRTQKCVRAKKASGGVGFLTKDSVLHQYKIFNIDKSVDGILVIPLWKSISTLNFQSPPAFSAVLTPAVSLVYEY